MISNQSIDLLQKKPDCICDPYPHFIIENALPLDVYQELYETRPTPEQIIGDRETTENQRIDIPTRRLKDISPIWRQFVDYHTSKEFALELLGIFGLLADKSIAKRLYASSYGVRGADNYNISMECQPGINTPLKSTMSVRGPHLDNPIELFGGMFYMPDPHDLSFGGELEIYRLIKKPKFFGKLEIEQDCCELVSVVPYQANTLVMFMNGPHSVHGVSPRTPTSTYRQLVNLIGEVQKPLFKVGHRSY